MFRAMMSSILRSTRLYLQVVVQCTDDNAPTMLSAGPDGSIVGALSSVHCTTMEIINKPLLLYLVGCIFYCISDARSKEPQTLLHVPILLTVLLVASPATVALSHTVSALVGIFRNSVGAQYHHKRTPCITDATEYSHF